MFTEDKVAYKLPPKIEQTETSTEESLSKPTILEFTNYCNHPRLEENNDPPD